MKEKPGLIKIHPELKVYTGYCLAKLAFRLRTMLDEELEPFGLVAPQCGILKVLKSNGPMTQVELGQHMAIDKATMVRLLDGLEEKQYLVRVSDKGDRRAKILSLTKAGDKAQANMGKVFVKVEDEFFASISKKERNQLQDILQRLLG